MRGFQPPTVMDQKFVFIFLIQSVSRLIKGQTENNPVI